MNSKFFTIASAARLEEKRRKQQEQGKDPGHKKGKFMRIIFSIFPLLMVPVAIYNIMAFGFGGSANDIAVGAEAALSQAPLLTQLNTAVFSIPMISGVKWTLTNGDLLLLLSVALLFIEILKSTSTGTATIMNHAVSMMLFIVCLIEFLLVANFATSVFFVITCIALLDVLAGVVVTIVSARRDFAVGEGFGG